MDIFTKAYLNIINEWRQYNNNYRNNYNNNKEREILQFPVQDVAYAVAEVTNDFKGSWVQGKTGKPVFAKAKEIYDKRQQNPDDPIIEKVDEKGPGITQEAFEYWENASAGDEFSRECKSMFENFICPSDKVGLFGYAIWVGVTVARFRKSVGNDFKIGDKVDLTLKFVEKYSSDSMYGTSIHDTFSCDKYPNVIFDVIFGKNGVNWDQACKGIEIPEDRKKIIAGSTTSDELLAGDVIEVEAKVKNIYPKKATIYFNYGKMKAVKSLTEEPKNSQNSKNRLVEKIHELGGAAYEYIAGDETLDLSNEITDENGWGIVIARDLQDAFCMHCTPYMEISKISDKVKNDMIEKFKTDMYQQCPGLSKYVGVYEKFVDDFNKLIEENQ